MSAQNHFFKSLDGKTYLIPCSPGEHLSVLEERLAQKLSENGAQISPKNIIIFWKGYEKLNTINNIRNKCDICLA